MSRQDSPGWDRQWTKFSWEWDFAVSTVSEGHKVVKSKEKSEAKTQGAKLTFGEVLDCGVLRMLHNLGAAHKSSFHDLGMGPGKMLIQTYLKYDNLKRCMGVELAKGRYDLAERNMRTLLKRGWRGRSFLGVEFKKGEFFKMVEDVPHKTPGDGWRVGDKVVAYVPSFKKDKMTVKDYHGVITRIRNHESGDINKSLYVVQYDDGSTCDGVQHRYLFIPGTERSCEVWFGSLFDYPGGFNAEICILETDFPAEMHPHLIESMCSTPIGCTFLTYHDLKKFPCFDWNSLRQIDCNIYDNDRYITSWSQGWRFYIWEHIHHFTEEKHYAPVGGQWTSDCLKAGDQILFSAKSKNDNELKYGEIVSCDNAQNGKLTVTSNRLEAQTMHYETMSLSPSAATIYRTRHRFRIGELVSAYYTDNFAATQHHQKYQIYSAKIIGVNAQRLSYVLQYTECNDQNHQITRLDVSEQHIFKTPNMLYEEGQQVMSCWPRNAQNKNCPHRYKRFPAKIIEVNNDGTYQLRFRVSRQLLSLLRPTAQSEEYKEDEHKKGSSAPTTSVRLYADTVREMWVQLPADVVETATSTFYMTYRPRMVSEWDNAHVLQWLCDIGVNEQTQDLFQDQMVRGSMLLRLNTKHKKACRESLRSMLLGKSPSGQHNEEKGGDIKTESVSMELEANAAEDGLGLSGIEMRNFFANLQYLEKEHAAMMAERCG